MVSDETIFLCLTFISARCTLSMYCGVYTAQLVGASQKGKKVIRMEFRTVFSNVGSILSNHDAYKALKAEYISRGYSPKEAQYAALGCLSGRSQGPSCRWYRKNGQVLFERLV